MLYEEGVEGVELWQSGFGLNTSLIYPCRAYEKHEISKRQRLF